MIGDTHRAAGLAVLLTTVPAVNLRLALGEQGVFDHLAARGHAVHAPSGWAITLEGEAWLLGQVVTGRHEFVPFTGGRFPDSCMRCGRVPIHSIHQLELNTSTPEHEEEAHEGADRRSDP